MVEHQSGEARGRLEGAGVRPYPAGGTAHGINDGISDGIDGGTCDMTGGRIDHWTGNARGRADPAGAGFGGSAGPPAYSITVSPVVQTASARAWARERCRGGAVAPL